MRRLLPGALALVLAASALAQENTPPPSVDKLVQQLGSSERDTRRDAAFQLSHAGPAAKVAVPALLKALKDEDRQVWAFSIAAIAALGPDAKEAIPELIGGFDSKKAGGRERSRQQIMARNAYALTRIGPAAIPPLIDALGQEDHGLRSGAARALGGMGKQAKDAVPALIKNFSDADEAMRSEMALALSLIGPDAGPALATALSDGDVRRRIGAAQAFAQFDAPWHDAGDALEKALNQEKDPQARIALLSALPKAGPAPERSVALLLPAITDDNETLRHEALNALAVGRSLHAAAVPKLAALLKNGNPAIRERAVHALGRLGSDAASAMPAILEATRASGGAPAFSNALAQVGPSALPSLLAILQKGNRADNVWVLPALRGYGTPAVPVLTEALKHSDPVIRAAAANTLGSMGRDASDAINPLFVLTGDADPGVQAATLRALVALHADSGRLKPVMQTALASPNSDVRKAAAAGMAAVGGAANLGVDGLVELISGNDAAGRLAAVQALGQLGPKAAPAVEPLAAHLDDLALQDTIIETLGKIGPAAAPAVPKLIDVAKKNNLQTSILPVLTVIGPGASAALPMIYDAVRLNNQDIRASGATALAVVEPDQSKAISMLVPLTSAGQNGKVRRAAAAGLARFGSASKDAIPNLITMLDRDTERGEGLKALRAIGVKTVPDLVKLLAHKEPRVRIFACDSLASVAPADGKDAIEPLQKLAEADPDPTVRPRATAALNKISPPDPK